MKNIMKKLMSALSGKKVDSYTSVRSLAPGECLFYFC